MDDIKYMPIDEFITEGFLQEVNRLVLHPAGLALELVGTEDDKTVARIWDYRDDPEGVVYGPGVIDPSKITRVGIEQAKHADARFELFGRWQQEEDSDVPLTRGIDLDTPLFEYPSPRWVQGS